MIPHHLTALLSRPAAVMGAGLSGRAAEALLKRQGFDVVVYDEHASDACQTFHPEYAQRHGLVVYSPGFSKEHPWLEIARSAGCRCLGELEFAAHCWQGRLIAITGTNGKTTLTQFLGFALRHVGWETVVAGNVGVPFSKVCAEASNTRGAVALCEVSSFQSESLEAFPAHTILWTNFSEDHLDRHTGLADYFKAKWRLIEVQRLKTRIIFGPSIPAAAERFGHTLPATALVVDPLEEDGIPPEGSVFKTVPQQDNYRLAHAFWRAEGLPLGELQACARRFRLPPHRLQQIAEIKGIRFWNDSKATNFAATLAALSHFDKPVYWIGGGLPKGGDRASFVRQLASKVHTAFLIGTTAVDLERELGRQGTPARRFATLEAAVADAYALATPQGNVVLSPGFASFDMFPGYAERGICFEKAVLSLNKRKCRL